LEAKFQTDTYLLDLKQWKQVLQKILPQFGIQHTHLLVMYVIVLPEHKNKTPNRVSGHKYSTCHFGQV